MQARLVLLVRRVLMCWCLVAAPAFAASLNGVWSYSAGGYLVFMEVQGGTVLALRVDPAMVSGEALLGTRNGDSVQVQSLSQTSSMAFTVSADQFSGSLTNPAGSTAVSGSLLLAYAGSAYDGLWQKNGDPTRYLAAVTLSANALPTTLLLDMKVNNSTSLSYDMALGTITTARTPTFRGSSLLGARTLSLVFGSTSPLTANYSVQGTTVPLQTLEQFAVTQLLAMAKASQTISFAAAPSLSVGGSATVSASASSGLPVSYSSLSSSVCSVSGSTVTGLTAGTCIVAANQSGNSVVEAAAQATQNLTVSAAARTSQSISFGTAPNLTVGASATLNASASSGLAVSYSSLTPSLCSVSASTVTALAAGTCSVAADQAGNTQYEAATRVTQAITISAANTAPTGVAVSKVSAQTLGSLTVYASTRLAVSWTAPSGLSVSQYRISAADSQGGSASTTAAATASSAELSDLKAGTSYAVTVSACADSACTTSYSASPVSASTEEEYWQLQGSGNSYTTLTKAVANGTSLSWVMQWGTEAGSSLNGRYQYYYKNNVVGRTGIGIAQTSAGGSDIATLSSFVEVTGTGLRNPCLSPESPNDCPEGALFINAVQAVPMTSGKVRVFFEAENAKESSKPTRIYALDSLDGLTGQDFHTSSSQAYCGGNGSTDYASGGACEPSVIFALASDTSSAQRSVLTAARQFKIGYPTQSSWLWDGAAGTFMVITGKDGCISYDNALFYGVYNGSQWALDTDASNCGKVLVANAHGPVLVHQGAARYKMYYEDESAGRNGKPLKLIYADGARSGAATTVDYADWESASGARNVHFVWPDNTLVNAQDESGLGDHMVLMPGGDTTLQTMYVNLGGFDNSNWGKASGGLGLARLLNP